MTSRLLIDEPPLLVLRSLAKVFGLNEAIILQQMHYRQTSERNKNHFDDRVWVRNTYEEWGQEFPFWGKNTIVRTIEKLHEQKLIITHMEQTGFRNLKFYSLDYDMLNELAGLKISSAAIDRQSNPVSENSEIDLPKMGRSTYQNAKPSESFCEIYTYKEQRGSPATQDFVDENHSLYRGERTPTASTGLGVGKNGQIVEINSKVQSTDYEISGSPSTQDGLLDLPNLGRPSTQNGYADLPNMGKTYKEAESFLRDINPPPLTPPMPESAKEEDEDEIPKQMILIWNELVQGKIPGIKAKVVRLTSSRSQQLGEIYRGLMNSQLCEWRAFCEQITGIKFLMGQGPNGFKVSLEWAIKPDNALKILEGKIYDKPGENEPPKQEAHEEFNRNLEKFFVENNYPQEWLDVYKNFAVNHGQSCFAGWLKECVPQAIAGSDAVLVAPTRFYRDYMETNFKHELLRLVKAIKPSVKDLTFEVRRKS